MPVRVSSLSFWQLTHFIAIKSKNTLKLIIRFPVSLLSYYFVRWSRKRVPLERLFWCQRFRFIIVILSPPCPLGSTYRFLSRSWNYLMKSTLSTNLHLNSHKEYRTVAYKFGCITIYKIHDSPFEPGILGSWWLNLN